MEDVQSRQHDHRAQCCCHTLQQYIHADDQEQPSPLPPCASPLLADLARRSNVMQKKLNLTGAIPDLQQLLQGPQDDTSRLVELARITSREWAPMLTDHTGQHDRAKQLREATTSVLTIASLYALTQARLGPEAHQVQSALEFALQLYTKAMDTTPHPTDTIARLAVNVALSMDAVLDIPFDTSMHDLMTRLAQRGQTERLQPTNT